MLPLDLSAPSGYTVYHRLQSDSLGSSRLSAPAPPSASARGQYQLCVDRPVDERAGRFGGVPRPASKSPRQASTITLTARFMITPFFRLEPELKRAWVQACQGLRPARQICKRPGGIVEQESRPSDRGQTRTALYSRRRTSRPRSGRLFVAGHPPAGRRPGWHRCALPPRRHPPRPEPIAFADQSSARALIRHHLGRRY